MTPNSTPSAEGVALLALSYRELATPADHANSLSLGAKIIYEALTGPTDDAIFEALEQPETLPQLLPQLALADPVRTEALLHAYPPADGLPADEWAEPFAARWDQVEHAMEWLCKVGIATPRDALDALAATAGGA